MWREMKMQDIAKLEAVQLRGGGALRLVMGRSSMPTLGSCATRLAKERYGHK
jgi:hypothetical protein